MEANEERRFGPSGFSHLKVKVLGLFKVQTHIRDLRWWYRSIGGEAVDCSSSQPISPWGWYVALQRPSLLSAKTFSGWWWPHTALETGTGAKFYLSYLKEGLKSEEALKEAQGKTKSSATDPMKREATEDSPQGGGLGWRNEPGDLSLATLMLLH